MSPSYFNYSDLRLASAVKSDDTADDAQRRREMRRKKQDASAKLVTHNRELSKNLLDEVLGKKTVSPNGSQSKAQAENKRPDMYYEGLPKPVQMSSVDGDEKYNQEKKLVDNAFPYNHSDTDCEITAYNQIDAFQNPNLTQPDEVSRDGKANEKLNQQFQFNSEAGQSTASLNRALSNSPAARLSVHLNKLQQEISTINEKRCQQNVTQLELVELAHWQAHIATSVDFLEGYAEGIIKDEDTRKLFDQECMSLRKQLADSDAAYINSVNSWLANQTGHFAGDNSSLIRDGQSSKFTISDKALREDRLRRFTTVGAVANQDKELRNSRLEDDAHIQRLRGVKIDHINSESTLPLIVQRSV